jgi:PAS domain S-box-containing protein
MRFLNSVKSLYAAVAILFLTIVLGFFVDVRNEAMHAQHLELNTSLERMIRLNQDLTNMLVIAVLKHNDLGTASYDTVKSDLKLTMTTVAGLTQTQGFAQEIMSLSTSQEQLRQREAMAIQLISIENWEAASDLLFGQDYTLAKKTYEVDSEAAVSAVMGELATTAQRFTHLRNGALALRVVALLLLIWVGVMFSRRSRAALAEQKRLRDEVTLAYQDMEERVKERTVDLEKTSQRLAVENEEREKSDQRTRLILNSAGDGIFGVDTGERVTFFNAAAARLLGYSAIELMDREIYRIIHHMRADGTPLPPEQCPMHLACAEGVYKRVSGELLWRKDGSHFLSEYSVTPILDEQGGHSGAVVVFRDISEQRRNQQELQQRMDELERFNRLTLGREDRMIQLKQEINALLQALGRDKKYRDSEASVANPAPVAGETGREP